MKGSSQAAQTDGSTTHGSTTTISLPRSSLFWFILKRRRLPRKSGARGLGALIRRGVVRCTFYHFDTLFFLLFWMFDVDRTRHDLNLLLFFGRYTFSRQSAMWRSWTRCFAPKTCPLSATTRSSSLLSHGTI
jgi:hypothetical protein